MFEFKSGIVLFCFSFTIVSFGESYLLVPMCAGGRCGMRAAMRIVAGVRDLVQRSGDGRTSRLLSGRTIERSGGTVCGLHRARGDEEHGFLGCASKPRLTVCQWFGLKTTRTVFVGLASKPVATVSDSLASKPAATVSSGLASKPAVTVFSGLASKPVVTVFSSLASKLVATVSPSLGSKLTVGFSVEP
jgi:hypothetical protein